MYVLEFLVKNIKHALGTKQHFWEGNQSPKTYSPHCFQHGLVGNKTASRWWLEESL